MNDLFREQNIRLKKMSAFAEAEALFDYRFEKDNGSVPKLEHARRYVEQWSKMRQEKAKEKLERYKQLAAK